MAGPVVQGGPVPTGTVRLVVLSEPDPVARALGERWGSLAASGDRVDGAPLRRLDGRTLVIRRPGSHLADDDLDQRLPEALRAVRPTLIFASVHRSETGTRCLTVHPLGNPGPVAELGGTPRAFTPADARTMAGLLRAMAEGASPLGLPATYEATHHGPSGGLPALFAEIAVGDGAAPAAEEVRVLDASIRSAEPDPRDRVAVGVGGGHYAPRFTDLTLTRQWAFGHILSRHALGVADATTVTRAVASTVGAEGIVLARAQDRRLPSLAGAAPELRESDAPRRGPAASGTNPRSSGT